MPLKVVFKVNISDDTGNIHFVSGEKYRLLHTDKTGYYISKEKKGNTCSHFPIDSVGELFEVIQ